MEPESKPGEGKVLEIKRTYNAPLDAVWQAWTDPQQFSQWWSPDGFTIPVCNLEVQPGGKFQVEMEGPNGTRYPSEGMYKEVVASKRLSFVNSPLDGAGNPLFEVLQTVEFAEESGHTLVTVISEVLKATPEAAPYLAGMEPGLNQALDKLGERVE